MESDALRQVRNGFYLGLYTQCMSDARELLSSSDVPADTRVYAEVFLQRAQCFLNPRAVLSSVPSNAHTALQVVKQYATYFAEPSQQDIVVEALQEWRSNDVTANDVTLTVVLASLFVHQRRYKEALQLVLNDAEQLEKLALSVLVYLLIDRHDLAVKQLKAMVDLDDDDVLTQLATAWTLIAHPSADVVHHSAKVLEAESILQGIQETFPTSQPTLTALSVCEMQKRSFTDAFKLLRQARDGAGEDGLQGAVLVDSIVSVQQMGRGVEKDEVMAAIKAEMAKRSGGGIEDEWREAQKRREAEFDKQAANYKWKE